MINRITNWLKLPYRNDSAFTLIFFMIFVVSIAFYLYLMDSFEAPRLMLIMLLTGISLVYAAYKSPLQFRISKPLAIAMGLFLVSFIVATIFSLDVDSSIFGYFARRSNSLAFIIAWVPLVFLMTRQAVEDKSYTFLRLWVVCALLIAIDGLAQSFGYGYYSGLLQVDRAVIPGLGGNQNFAAMTIAAIAPFLLALGFKTESTKKRIAYSVSGFILIWSLMVFASRGSIVGFGLALVFGLGIALIRKLERKTIFTILAAIALTAILAISSYTVTRTPGIDKSLQPGQDVSTTSRIAIWVQTVDLIKHHPLTGVGPSNFVLGYNTVFIGQQRFDDPHNLYLQTAATAGLPALALLLIVIYFAFRAYLINFWRSGSLLQLSLLMGFVSLLISVSFNPATIVNWLLLGFFIAFSQSQVGVYQNEKLGRSLRIPIAIAGVIIAVAGVSFLAGEFLEGQMEHAYQARNYAKCEKYAQLSHIFNPFNSYVPMYGIAAKIKLQQQPDMIRGQIASLANEHKHSAVSNQYAGTLSFMLSQYSKNPVDQDNALHYFDIANTLDQNHNPVLTSYAYIAYKSGKKDLAQKLLEQALSLKSQNPSFINYLLLAEIQLENGQGDAMYASLKHAYELQQAPPIKTLMDSYKAGTFKATQLPMVLPPPDII